MSRLPQAVLGCSRQTQVEQAGDQMGASVLAKMPGHTPNLQRLKYSLREQAHSHKGRVRHQSAAADMHSWERACSKMSGHPPNLQRLKYSLREQAHSHKGCVRHAICGGWHALVGASLLAKMSGRPLNIQRLKCSLREQAHSHKGRVRHAICGG